MNFTNQGIKQLIRLKKDFFDQSIITFLEGCSLINNIQFSKQIAKVYGTFENFHKRIQDKESHSYDVKEDVKILE